MADIFEDKLEQNLRWLKEEQRNAKIADRVKVDAEHRFVGFDAYQKLLRSDIDIVMLCTPPGYRPMHFEAAVEAKKHVFCEKPFGTDPVGVRRFMEAAQQVGGAEADRDERRAAAVRARLHGDDRQDQERGDRRGERGVRLLGRHAGDSAAEGPESRSGAT